MSDAGTDGGGTGGGGEGGTGGGSGEKRRLHLFDAVGVELEYMVVDRGTLAVRPVVDRLLAAAAPPGAPPIDEEPEIERGLIHWSNELVLHVVEMKTGVPARSPREALGAFESEVRAANALLEPLGACLLPAAMHPFMVPDRDMHLWPHEHNAVYQAFHRIFDCRGHGWANLQSMHLNLPFQGDAEFGRLHAAIRLVLPILPALAASSPFQEGRLTGSLDQRLEVYRNNARRIPTVMGRIIPEPVFDEASYREGIFEPMFRDIAPFDPDGVLRHEWLNSRGAIARFGRGSIEIRVIDVQETPRADVAIAELVLGVLRGLCEERWSSLASQQSWGIDPLERIFLDTIRDADRARIDQAAYLRLFGLERSTATAGELWAHLAEVAWPTDGDPRLIPARAALDVILREGPLARRIVRALRGDDTSRDRQLDIYARLAHSLNTGDPFLAS